MKPDYELLVADCIRARHGSWFKSETPSSRKNYLLAMPM
jgi:hypothetical protein